MAKKPGPNKENMEASRRAFLSAGRHEFSEQGYVKSSTERIVKGAGMARGSLYYHFKDKRGLFLAVYEETAHEIREDIKKETSKIQDPWEAFLIGANLYLDYCLSPKTRKLIYDGYVVLTYEERLSIMNKTLLGTMKKALGLLQELGYFKNQDLESLSILVAGMIVGAATHLSAIDSSEEQKQQFKDTFIWFMEKANQ
jgi:AcrR family transcriptional regulator